MVGRGLLVMRNEESELISADPGALHRQARIPGTRIPVSLILGCLAEGMTEQEVLDEYPHADGRGDPSGGRLRCRAGLRADPSAVRDARTKTDENIPRAVVRLLFEHGHDIHTVADAELVGVPDLLVAEAAANEARDGRNGRSGVRRRAVVPTGTPSRDPGGARWRAPPERDRRPCRPHLRRPRAASPSTPRRRRARHFGSPLRMNKDAATPGCCSLPAAGRECPVRRA
jgi:hypothetical protein